MRYDDDDDDKGSTVKRTRIKCRCWATCLFLCCVDRGGRGGAQTNYANCFVIANEQVTMCIKRRVEMVVREGEKRKDVKMFHCDLQSQFRNPPTRGRGGLNRLDYRDVKMMNCIRH